MVHSIILTIAAPCKRAPVQYVAVTAVLLGGMVVAVKMLQLGTEMIHEIIIVVRQVPVVGIVAEYSATTKVQREVMVKSVIVRARTGAAPNNMVP